MRMLNKRMRKRLNEYSNPAIEQLEGIHASASRVETASGALDRL